MEYAGQRLYSVLQRTEVREKMMKEIEQISEIFSLSKSDATVILIRLRWNSFHASDRLNDNREKFLAEVGLVQAFESFSFFADEKLTHFGGGEDLISTPFCSHKFCTTCWRDYLNEFLLKKKSNNNEEEELVVIPCLEPDCTASVGPDTIEKFAEPVKRMYERYVIDSFVVSKKNSIKWCPALYCEYAIERHGEDQEDGEFDVVCLCGHIFCWNCKLDSHRPLTCKNASLWLDRLFGVAMNLTWITQLTRRCPKCNISVLKDGDPDLRLITCICGCPIVEIRVLHKISRSFCWVCFRSGEEHNGRWNCAPASAPTKDASLNAKALKYHLSLWEATGVALVKAKSDVKAIEENMIPILTGSYGLGEQDMRALREAWMLIVQCRQVLKWSSLFGYFMTEDQYPKKPYLEHLGEEANTVLLKHKETLHELINGAISAGDITSFKQKVETSTRNTGNYFHYFVKSLENGLPQVEVGVDEDASSRYWFCYRCKFQNCRADRECKVCLIPFDCVPPPPPSLVEYGNNNTANEHHQQVLNMPKNPFGSETNPWKFD